VEYPWGTQGINMKKFIDWHNRMIEKIWEMATSPAKKEPSVFDFLPRTKGTENLHKAGDQLASLKNLVNFWTKKFIVWMLIVWASTYFLYLISKIFWG